MSVDAFSIPTGWRRLCRGVAEHLGCVSDWVHRALDEHITLMRTSPAYRHSLHTGIVAILTVLRAHPLLSVIATALLALYVSAYDRTERATSFYDRYETGDGW